MIKRYKILTTLILLFISGITFSQNIEASWVVPPTTKINAGKTYTSSLKIYNHSEQSQIVQAKINLPKAWLALSTANKATIAGGDSLVVLFTLRPPNTALAQTYPLKVEILDSNNTLLKGFRYALKIRKGFKISVEDISQRNYVTSQEEFVNTYQIVNNSNVAVELELKAKNSKLLGTDTLYLRPGEAHQVSTQVKAPQSFSKISNQLFGLKIECDQFDTTTTTFQNVEVFPDTKYQEDPYKRFPVTLSLNYLAREANGEYIQALQGELFAKGSINENNKDQLEIKLKGPDRVQYSLFGNYEEYYARYQSKNYNLWVGDMPLTVTNLTERGRFVRGVNGSVRMKQVTLNAFYGRSRFFPDIKDEYGAKLDYTPIKNLNIGAATLYKNFNAPDSSAIIPTVYTEYISQKFTFNGELAYGTTGTTDGYAFDLRASTNIGRVKVSARALQADQYFPGFLRNSQIGAFNINYRLDNLQFGILANYRNSNPSLDTFFVAAPISYNALANVVYRINDRSSFEFRVGQTRRTDRFEPKRFDYTEFINRIAFKQVFESWDYDVYTEYGRNQNFLFDENNGISASYISGFSASVRLSESFRASTNVIFQNTNRYAIERTNNFIAGGRLFWKYSSRSNVTLAYRNNYDFEDVYQTQDQFEFYAQQFLGRNHSVAFTLRYAKPRRQISGKSLFITAKYVYRFDMPFQRKKNRGKIRGRVFTADSSGIDNVKLRITNNKAVTESNGAFLISGLAYGTYYVTIDRSSLNIDQITEKPMPMKVEVTETNPSPNASIKIVQAGKISGNIMYPKIKNKLLDNKSSKFRPVYIEINNGKERYIQPCDTLGDFSFDHIRPGKWKVRLIESTLDENFIYTKTKTTVEIKPGESRELKFKARRKQKQLRMVSPPIKLTATRKTKQVGGTK